MQVEILSDIFFLDIIMQNPFKIGDGVTEVCHSDMRPYTVIGVGKKSLKLQEDRAELLNASDSGESDALQHHVGGFCANATGEQRYQIESDPQGHVCKAHWSEKRGCFLLNGRLIINGRQKFYDYDF